MKARYYNDVHCGKCHRFGHTSDICFSKSYYKPAYAAKPPANPLSSANAAITHRGPTRSPSSSPASSASNSLNNSDNAIGPGSYVIPELKSTTTKVVLNTYGVLVVMRTGLSLQMAILSQPLIHAKILGNLKAYDRVDAYQVIGDYIRIQYQGKPAFVRVRDANGVELLRVKS